MASPYQFGTRSEETRILQQTLSTHQPPFDTKGTDGIFGKDTRDAVQAAQEFYAISPADGVVRADLLVELGITAPTPPASNPITDFFTGLAIQAFVQKLKGLPEMNNILLATGTGVTGLLMIVVGVGSLVNMVVPLTPIPGFQPLTPG